MHMRLVMQKDVVLDLTDLAKAGHEDLVTAVMETTGEGGGAGSHLPDALNAAAAAAL